MDYSPALQPSFDYLWYLIPLSIFTAFIDSPRSKCNVKRKLVKRKSYRMRNIF